MKKFYLYFILYFTVSLVFEAALTHFAGDFFLTENSFLRSVLISFKNPPNAFDAMWIWVEFLAAGKIWVEISTRLGGKKNTAVQRNGLRDLQQRTLPVRNDL